MKKTWCSGQPHRASAVDAEQCASSLTKAVTLRSSGPSGVLAMMSLAVSEHSSRAEDSDVIQMALSEERIVLTEDKDFGQLVYASGQQSQGIILIRFPAKARATLPGAITKLAQDVGEDLVEAFVVVRPGRIRITHGPLG